MTLEYPDQLIQQTKVTWQPYYEEELSDEEAIEIIDNWRKYMGLIQRWVELSPANTNL